MGFWRNRLAWILGFWSTLPAWVRMVIQLLVASAAAVGAWQTQRTMVAVRDITDNLTTTYIGAFPRERLLLDINATLNEADNRILIASDFPGYGIYSQYEQFLEYKRILESKRAFGVQVQLLVLDERHRMERVFVGATFKELSNSPSFRSLQKRHRQKIESLPQLREIIAADQRKALASFRASLSAVKETTQMPLHVWVVDDHAAVLAVRHPRRDQADEEAAFLTRDRRLVEQLAGVFETYWQNAH